MLVKLVYLKRNGTENVKTPLKNNCINNDITNSLKEQKENHVQYLYIAK